LEFLFPDRKICSRQFGTYSHQFGILSCHRFFQFHESENVPTFVFWPAIITSTHFEYMLGWQQLILSRCEDDGMIIWPTIITSTLKMAATPFE
jgi:hypothetical protein